MRCCCRHSLNQVPPSHKLAPSAITNSVAMPIYRCNQCGFTSEESRILMGLHATLTHVTPMQLKKNWLVVQPKQASS